MFFLVSCLISFSYFSVARGKLQAVCSSGMTVLENPTAYPGVMKINGTIPYNRNLQLSCVLKMDTPESCLHVKAKRSGNSQGFLKILVYEGSSSSTLLGHVDVSQPAWNSQTICPPSPVKPRFMSVLGASGLSFAVDLSPTPSEIPLDKPETFDVKSTKAIVLPFNPPKDISDRQLDITINSTSNIPAYLKVSQIRQDVDENIEVVDYKKKSLRLSFAKKGRITLSKASEPPLTDSSSSWFIGIALKNSTGSLKASESKTVTLKLSQSFDYSYAGPICALFFLSLGFGILLSGLAVYLFEESLVIVNVSNRDQDIQPNNRQGNNNNSQSNKCVRVIKFIFAMMKVTYSSWFSGGPKTYSYATGVVGFVLMVGACQFVVANWYIMIQEGDRDNCYYNDFCYRVSDYHDIPLNLMISNLTYIVHALILTVCVLYMETKLYLFCENLEKSVTSSEKSTEPSNGQENAGNVDNCQSTSSGCQSEALPNHIFLCPNITPHLQQGAVPEHTLGDKEKKKIMARALKRKYSYSIGYAFAWALLLEGLFSLLYHLCPSRYTFQFDSAFMFVIAGLTVLLVYNGMELSECPVHQAEQNPVEELSVGALNFFLYFIVPLFIFNYLATLYHSESGLVIALQVVFFLALFIWWVAMGLWAFHKLARRKGILPSAKCMGDREMWLNAGCYICGFVFIPPGLFVWFLLEDLSQVFLFTCIVESVLAVSAKAKLLQKLWKLLQILWKLIRHCKCPDMCTGLEFLQGLYIVFTVVVLAAAFSVFQALQTTDKTASPEHSRDHNKECAILEFFDWHDLWHFLSSFGLLMGAFVIMFISAEPKNGKTPRWNGARKSESAGRENYGALWLSANVLDSSVSCSPTKN